jgi:hypothetical protein
MASTAEKLRAVQGLESPFAEVIEEEVVEELEEANEELVEETGETSEVETEEDVSEEEVEDEEKLTTVNENLNRALKEERGLRQTAQSELSELKKLADVSKQIADDAEEQIASVIAQLKELDLEDLIKIEGKVDPKVREMMAEKDELDKAKAQETALAEFNKEMVSKVNTSIVNFKNIDLKNDDQGIALQHMIYMASMSGMDMESSVKDSMERLDRMLSSNLKKRTPPVKPTKKLKSVSKTVPVENMTPMERIRRAREAAENK